MEGIINKVWFVVPLETADSHKGVSGYKTGTPRKIVKKTRYYKCNKTQNV